MNITREMLFSMPSWTMVLTYLTFFISVVIFLVGISKKIQFVTNGKGFKELTSIFPKKLYWKAFFNTLLLQGKVSRNFVATIFHSSIFISFIILTITTTVVAIHQDTPLKIFVGNTYIFLSILADFAGFFLLVGLLIAIYRRFVQKPSKLDGADNSKDIIMYLFLASFVVIGFMLEIIRLIQTGMPSTELICSPVGFPLAKLVLMLGIPNSTLTIIYQVSWFFHMLSTMAFIAILPFTKFFHIVIGPFQALITEPKTGGILLPMDFENEDAETFGLGKPEELTIKNRLDLVACIECGRCTDVCPATASGKLLSPKLIVSKIRDFTLKTPKGDFWESELFAANELDACTTCGACMEECPMEIQHINLIQEAKRYKVLTLGEIPPAAGDAVNKIKTQGNPWGISQEDRFKWADGLDVPVIDSAKKVDYLYYVGCAGSYDPANQDVTKDTIALLKKAGVDFAVMGKNEKCNGDPIRRFGDEYSFYEVALENIATINQYQFDKIIVQCPHCLHTIGKEYSKFDDGHFDVVHHTELLADLLKNNKLTPTKRVEVQLTFHDPCYLGRHHGEYNAPREILKSIPGLTLVEMDKNKDEAVCCGMGGGNMWYELPEGEHIAKNRLEDVGKTKMPQLATACSFCLINFDSTKVQVSSTEELTVNDVANYLAKSVL